MNSFSEYMGKVKAEEELKIKTGSYVRTAFSSAERQKKAADSGPKFRRKKFVFNNALTAVSAVAVCLILTLCGRAYYHTPVNYLCLDINPSVELGINAFGRVVSILAYNEDGFSLLRDNQYVNLSVVDAVGTLVHNAMKQGFIAGDGSTVIAVTAESNREKAAAQLQSSGDSAANSTLSAGGISAIVYSDCTDLQFRKQAQDAGISPGKLRLIMILQTLDPSIAIEDYKNAKMTDIITKANELLTRSGSGLENGKDAEILQKIRSAAQQVQAAYAKGEQEQNRSGAQNQNQGSGEQEQNQGPNDSGIQNQVQNQGSETKQQIQSRSPDTGQQAQNQSVGTGQQQTQAPEEQTQNQLQGGDASVSSPNKGQTTGTQSGDRETVQDDGGGSQISSATENGTPTSGNDFSSGTSSENGKSGK